MMSDAPAKPIRIFCVDDNTLVTEALRLQLSRTAGLQWTGCAPDADSLLDQAKRECSDIVLLDIDMPGKNPFDAINELTEICGHSRVLMYSGLLRRDLVDRALDSGAWGYVAKTDGEQDLLQAIRAVAGGSMGFSRSIRTMMGEN
jgi:DNA-binding NarL/FixJ family response regulator